MEDIKADFVLLKIHSVTHKKVISNLNPRHTRP